MADKTTDERFSKVFSDPRFRTLRKTDKTLKIDNRFKSMFTEDKFKLKYSMDKRGKSKKHLISEDYKKFYRLSDEEDEDEKKDVSQDHEDSDHAREDALPAGQTLREAKLTHKLGYHRGIDRAFEEDSSSSSSESEESEDEEEEFEHKWGELDQDAEEIDHPTSRIAICNADWDRINAQDLFVLLNSFKRATGTIHSVSVFFSKFGEDRLKVEDVKGPSEFIFGKAQETSNASDRFRNPTENQIDSSDDEEEEAREKHAQSEESDDDDQDDEDEVAKDSKAMEKLRKYQLERMKYFYAVVEFDSPDTADVIYNELDGMEYESSSTTLDIRFIPDDTTFDDVKLKEQCTSMPNSTSYTAPAFINTALQQSKVKLTWDETDPKRQHAFDKAFEQDKEDDLKAYLASSSDDELDNEEDIDIDHDMKDHDKIDKYKNLLKSLDNNKDEDFEMEVTWDPSLKSTAEDIVNKKESHSKPSSTKKTKSSIKQSKPLAETSEDESDDEHLKANDLVSDSEEEMKQTQRNNSKEKFKKWKNKKRTPQVNDDTLKGDSSNLELLMVDIEKEPNKKHFNYKEIVDQYSKKESKNNKAKSGMEPLDLFKFNADDPRFGAIYSSHIFNIDQSDPHFKKTEAFEQILNRRKDKASQMIKDEKSSTKKQEVDKPQNKSWASLVRKVKDKTGGELQRKRQVGTKSSEESRFNTNKKFRR